MSPAAGGAAPTQPAAASAAPSPAPTIAASQAPTREVHRDPAAQAEGADPGNAAARRTAWNVPPPPPAPGAGIIGGDESWPALADSAARAWPKSASSDSLSSGSAPSAPEDSVVPLMPQPQPVSAPIPTAPSPGPDPASTSPPPSATATASSSPRNGSTSQPVLVRHGGGNGDNNGGGGGGNASTHSQSTANNSSDGGNSSSGGDGNWNDGGLGAASNLNSSVHSGGNGGSGIDNSRRVFSSNNWNGNGRGRGGGGSYKNDTGSGDGGNRHNGGSGSGHWNNNVRNGGGNSNGFGGRGGRNRREHERGSNFSPRNYSRALPVQQQQHQQQGYYQPGPFQRPLPPPPVPHFMLPQPFVPYVQPIAYPSDVQAYPYYVTQVEQQFQNMHLLRPPMQPLALQQDQINLQDDIQLQIEHYFSTNNLCHDTYLRGHMDDQGWVPIDLIAGFPMLTRFTMLGVDTNYILDSIRNSELLEVQGNNVRRRNDWAAWLLHRGPPPSN